MDANNNTDYDSVWVEENKTEYDDFIQIEQDNPT